jgi:hypothetical protein
MTPKEKASWLVLKFMSKLISLNISKQCALVTVDEIMTALAFNYVGYDKEYWEEVKQEIQKA